MEINDLMDLTVRELLENYVSIQSLECGYYYGITTPENAEKIFDEYNINEEYGEGFFAENLINDELLLDSDKPLLTYEKMVTILNNLGISKKEE